MLGRGKVWRQGEVRAAGAAAAAGLRVVACAPATRRCSALGEVLRLRCGCVVGVRCRPALQVRDCRQL